MPYAARMEVRPSPFGSKASARRGAKLFSLRLATPLPGYPGSPGNISPAGALLYTVLLTPWANKAGSKWAVQPYFVDVGRYGSQRRPALMVRREVAFQASCT